MSDLADKLAAIEAGLDAGRYRSGLWEALSLARRGAHAATAGPGQ
jgi:hypothetical protein